MRMYGIFYAFSLVETVAAQSLSQEPCAPPTSVDPHRRFTMTRVRDVGWLRSSGSSDRRLRFIKIVGSDRSSR
jgi:hypothetical protein